MRWSDLPLEQVLTRLAALGIDPEWLIRDARDVPELGLTLGRLARMSWEEKLRVALTWFGDEQNPRPEQRSDWGIMGSTPDWTLPPLADAEQPKEKRPRHRPPDRITVATVKQLKWELAQRKAKPGDREFTQEKIGARLEVDRSRIQQAEALERVGWDLLRSHPEFSANDGFVRWPSAAEAARILASERAEN